MKRYLYKKTAEDHARFGRQLWADIADDDQREYIISLKLNRNIRSIPQNAMFHAICQIYAMYTGHTLEEIKDEFKRERFYELKVDKQGNEFKRLKSTKGLDTLEFTSLINNLMQWGQEHHPTCIVPRREDMHYQRLMEIEDQYEREFSGL